MNILTDNLPEVVVCGSAHVPIKTDFRAWIAFSICISDSSRPDEMRIAGALDAVIDGRRKAYGKAEPAQLLRGLFEFYAPGSTAEGKKKKQEPKGKKRSCFDFAYDADLIFASFLQCYGIDLTETSMHWHKFRALLGGLPEDCRLSKVISYRLCDTSRMTGEEKKHYEELKRIYALPDNRTREEKDAECYEALSQII